MRDYATLSMPPVAAVAPPLFQPASGDRDGLARGAVSDAGVAAAQAPVAGAFAHSFGAVAPRTTPRATRAGEPDENAANLAAAQAAAPLAGATGNMGGPALRPPASSSASEPRARAAANPDGAIPQLRPVAPGAGQPLGRGERSQYESMLGANLGDVRIHADSAADAGSRALDARAFTRGRDIHFRRGHYQPHTAAGRWLLTHELTHAIRSRANVVARNGVGTPMGPATNLRPSTPVEDREFVGMAVEFIQRGKERYDPALTGISGKPRKPVFATPPVARDQLVRQLDGWKATTAQCLTLIQTTLNNDAGLDQQLREAYRSAVEAAVSAAATSQSKSRHELYDEHRDRVLDWAWPAAVADPNRNGLSDALAPAERGQIRTVTTSISLGSADPYFAANVVPIALPTNTTLRFGGAIPPKLQAGLQNIAGNLAGMSNGLELNSTLTLGLDLGKVGGDYAAYRFTRVRHAAKGAQPATDEILVEHLGTIGLERNRPGELRKQTERFTSLGLTLGPGWGASPDFETSAELQDLLRGITGIPDATFARVPGLTINRASTSAIDPSRAGEYSFGTNTITLFDSAFTTSLTRFGTPGAGLSTASSFTIRHEIGHALDQVSLRAAMNSWNTSVTRLNAQVARPQTEFAAERTSPTSFRIPAARRPAWDALQRDIAGARRNEQTQAQARDAARGLSGGRLQLKTGTNIFESVQGPVAAGSSAFRTAATQDGVRVTHYSDESWLEYFAETYALFVSAPDDLSRLRPHVFAFMQATFP